MLWTRYWVMLISGVFCKFCVRVKGRASSMFLFREKNKHWSSALRWYYVPLDVVLTVILGCCSASALPQMSAGVLLHARMRHVDSEMPCSVATVVRSGSGRMSICGTRDNAMS